MTVEAFRRIKTNIQDLEKLQEVKRSLLSPDAMDRLRQRARIRREYNTQPISQPVISQQSPSLSDSDSPYQANRYDPDSDRWVVSSLTNPSEQFLADLISTGGVGTGAIVRGYPPTAIESGRHGRRFTPVEQPKAPKDKEIEIQIQIGYTGRK